MLIKNPPVGGFLHDTIKGMEGGQFVLRFVIATALSGAAAFLWQFPGTLFGLLFIAGDDLHYTAAAKLFVLVSTSFVAFLCSFLVFFLGKKYPGMWYTAGLKRFFIAVVAAFVVATVVIFFGFSTLLPQKNVISIDMLLGQSSTQNNEVSSPTPDAVITQSLLQDNPITPFYKGVSIQAGVATVDFAEGARSYINSAPSLQASYLDPIKNALSKISGVAKVQWSIDGNIITGFDV